jgi:hypothetical protein
VAARNQACPDNDPTYRFRLIVETLAGARVRDPASSMERPLFVTTTGVPSFNHIRDRRHADRADSAARRWNMPLSDMKDEELWKVIEVGAQLTADCAKQHGVLAKVQDETLRANLVKANLLFVQRQEDQVGRCLKVLLDRHNI